LIHAEELTRSFDGRIAVDQLSFEVATGQLFALLGPNGAGKTTTVRLLLGLIGPTAGTATVAGHSITVGDRSSLRQSCGLLTEAPGFYDRLSAWDNLLFFGALYGIPSDTLQQRCTHFLTEFGLFDRRNDLIATFSKGMKQKLAIVRALFHEPDVLFMDEPTAGLDPAAARDIRELIRGLKQQGRTILLCTHNLDEAERLADVVGIMRQRLLVCAPLDQLRRANGKIRIETMETDDATQSALRQVPAIHSVSRTEQSYEITTHDAPAVTPDVVALLVQRGARIVNVDSGSESLEAIYLRHITGDL
jgi:ABC-2 type transport system ATP-binding protein